MNQLFKTIVIDDEPAARRLMRNLLQEHSDVVEIIGEASNGKEAIEKIGKLKPDLVFP
jgi:two-component system LytT family response regulator